MLKAARARLVPSGPQNRTGPSRSFASTASGFNRRHVGTNSFQLGPSWDQNVQFYGLIR